MANNPIRVLLVDDHVVVRNGVRLMLGCEDDILIAGEAANSQEALRLVQAQEFDVALLDVAMPGRNGLELQRLIRNVSKPPAILFLSTYAEEVYAMRALKLGAAGYLTKDSPAPVLVAAVRKAASGGKYLTPGLAEKIAIAMGGSHGASHAALSDRELEVMKMIADGNSLVHIAANLHLSPNTVTTYRSRILQKLDLSSNAELTRYAMENGLLP
ncbi:response regulator [Duganella radicis]|uniref:Response regulator n=1 Tax=Duganella radicis TaxID=551988 RepID=A0A6L6PCV9_9BURK|nr:response regulator transcription factor [Duganella radicis]MTV36357.1 response regulator [Duganella radicis]